MTALLRGAPLGVRIADPADAPALDAWVRAQPGATPFHRPAWTAATARGTRQRAHYLVAEQADGAVAGVLPLTEVRSPIFGAALVSAGFGTDGGILAPTPTAVEPLAAEAWSLAERLGIGSVELRGGPVPAAAGWHAVGGTYLNFARDLAADDAAELARIPRKRRAVVRQALSRELAVTVDRDLSAHYAVYAESVRNLGTPVFPRALFAAVLDAFGDDADILTIRLAGVPVASVLSLYFAGTVYPYWGGGTAAARALVAADLMYFALMRHARARGCTRFDFGRSKAGTGPAAYKGHWGFAGVPLTYAMRTAPGVVPRVVNPLDPKYRLQVAVWQRLPLAVANRLGPLVARGLG